MNSQIPSLVTWMLCTCWAGLALLVAGCGQTAQSTEALSQSSAVAADADSGQALEAKDQESSEAGPALTSTGNGMEAMEQAAAAGKYLLAFFWKDDRDQNTIAMREVFDAAAADYADRADAVAVKITEDGQEEIVEEFGLERAPMPIALVIAPNGAVTGGYPTSFKARDFESAFVSPATTKLVKAMQENKLVFLCAQNSKTESNEEAMEGVRDFKANQPYPELIEIVKVDPADSAEADFLKDLQIAPDLKTAVTVMVAPPGVPIGRVEGPTAKELFADLLSQAQSGCAGGACGPGGCGP